MPLWNGLRRRVSLQQLLLYLVDEDYTRTRRGRASRDEARDPADIDQDLLMRMGLMHSSSTDDTMNVIDSVYDPDEPVPLYELLQEHHRGSAVHLDEAPRPSMELTPPNECLTPPDHAHQYLDPSSLTLVTSNNSSRSTLLHLNSRFFDRRRVTLREQSREPQPKNAP